MKLNRKILGLAIALIMLFSSTIPAFAAMPIDTVIVENKAYDFEYFQNNAEAILDVQAALDAGENVYVKFDGGILNVVINEFLENSEELPEVEYYDKDGNVTRYEAGDGDPVESEFKVIEISAINAKEAKIVFSKAVNQATVIAAGNLNTTNITFTPIGTAQAPGTIAASLSDDGKTLNLTAGNFFNGQYAVVVTTGVQDTEGNAIEAYSTILNVDDNTRPTISTPVYSANGKAKFEFSEPIDATAASIASAMTITKVEDGSAVTVAAGQINLASDNKSFVLDMTATTPAFVANKEYTVAIVGLKDFAGNLITPNPVQYTLVNTTVDDVAPTVTGIVVKSTTQFTIQFSEELAAAPTVTLGGTDVTTTTPAGAVVVDPNEPTKYNVTLGAAASGIQTVGVAAGYADNSGNTGAAWSKLVEFKADTTGPTYVSHEVKTLSDGKLYLIVKFDEELAGLGTAINTLSGSYVDQDSITHTGINVAAANASLYDADNNPATPTDSIKVDLSGLNSGNYTMTVNTGAAADAATNDSVAKEITFTVGTLADTTKPVVFDADSDPTNGYSGIVIQGAEDTVTVQFNENVTAATALNVNNYTVEGQVVFEDAIFVGDRQHVTLTLKPNVITVGGDRNFTIANVANDAGLVMDTLTTTQTFQENVKPTITKAQLITATTIDVTFSENMNAATITDADDFEVYVDGTKATVSGVTGTTNVYTITFGTPSVTDLTKPVTIKVVEGNDITDATTPGNSLATTGTINVQI